MSLIIPLVLIALAVPLLLALMRANELFVLRVRSGRITILRGKLPQGLLDEIADVVRPVERASLRVVVESARARMYVEGELSDEIHQRLRNVLGLWPLAKIRAGARRRSR